MCMVTKADIPVKVAKKDIVCYKEMKWISNDFEAQYLTSYFQGVEYKVNKVYKNRCNLKGKKRDYNIRGKMIDFVDVNRGFHSYVRKPPNPIHYKTYVVVKCIIPKGSLYREGWDNYPYKSDSYISNAIKIVEVLE